MKDDTLILASATNKSIKFISKFLISFQKEAAQKINYNKSQLLFGATPAYTERQVSEKLTITKRVELELLKNHSFHQKTIISFMEPRDTN